MSVKVKVFGSGSFIIQTEDTPKEVYKELITCLSVGTEKIIEIKRGPKKKVKSEEAASA